MTLPYIGFKLLGAALVLGVAIFTVFKNHRQYGAYEAPTENFEARPHTNDWGNDKDKK